MNSSLVLSHLAEPDDPDSFLATALSVVSSSKNKETSPVTLSPEWSRMGRLLLLSILSVVGSIGNVFMISSVMIEDHLKRTGNAFIVNVALADLLITSILIPASTIVLLAGIDESLAVCKVQWFFAACAFVVSVISLAVTAIENYYRLCSPQDDRKWFNRSRTTTILILIWIVGCTSSGLQFIFHISFDYCNRKSNELLSYQSTIVLGGILVFLIITLYTHVKIIIDVKRLMNTPNFKPKPNYTGDLSLARANFYSYIFFVVFWLPFGIVLAYGSVAIISNRVFYNAAWVGLCKSCFHNVIYCIANRHFRNAYINLFHYCCCKTTVSVSRRQRGDGCRPSADVRVHIIPGYNMYSYTSPQRAGNCHGYWNKRDVHEL